MYGYIHGLNSDIQCRSYEELSAILPDVHALSYDYTKDAHEGYQELCEQVEMLMKQGHALTLLGSSLGGYYALHMGHRYAIRVVAFNPVTYPQTQLRAFLGENRNFYTQKVWDLTEEILFSYNAFPLMNSMEHCPTVIIGRNDEILDYRIAHDFWQKYANIVLSDDFHSIMEYNLYMKYML